MQINDVVFAVHALALSLFTGFQALIFKVSCTRDSILLSSANGLAFFNFKLVFFMTLNVLCNCCLYREGNRRYQK